MGEKELLVLLNMHDESGLLMARGRSTRLALAKEEGAKGGAHLPPHTVEVPIVKKMNKGAKKPIFKRNKVCEGGGCTHLAPQPPPPRRALHPTHHHKRHPPDALTWRLSRVLVIVVVFTNKGS